MKHVFQLGPEEDSVEFYRHKWNEVQIELGEAH